METARDESCPSCQIREPVAPEDNMLSSPDEKSFNIGKLQRPGGGNGDPPGRFRLPRCANPNPTGWSLCHGACARRKSCLSGQRRRSAAPERTRSHYCIGKSSISLRPLQPGNRDGDCSGLYRLAGYANSNPTGWLLSHQEIPRIEGYTSGQLRSPATSGEDRASFSGNKCFYVCHIRSRPPTKAVIPQVDTTRNGVETSTPLAGC